MSESPQNAAETPQWLLFIFALIFIIMIVAGLKNAYLRFKNAQRGLETANELIELEKKGQPLRLPSFV